MKKAIGNCIIAGCDKPKYSRGWCRVHYNRWYNTGKFITERAPKGAWRGKTCTVPGCTRPMWMAKQAVCYVHYHRLHRTGCTEISRNEPGTGSVASGYKIIQENYSKKQEHREIIEHIIGRKLLPREVVHHLDGNKLNNNPSNLVLCSSQSEHMRKYHSNRAIKMYRRHTVLSIERQEQYVNAGRKALREFRALREMTR